MKVDFKSVGAWCGVQDVAGTSFDLKQKEGIHAVSPACHFARTHVITVG